MEFELVFRVPTNPDMEIWRRKRNHHLLIAIRRNYRWYLPKEAELLDDDIYNHPLEKEIYPLVDMYNRAVNVDRGFTNFVFKILKEIINELERIGSRSSI